MVLTGRSVRAVVPAEIGELVAMATADGSLDTIAIDIPIGLADRGVRRADLLARAAAGRAGRRCSCLRFARRPAAGRR